MDVDRRLKTWEFALKVIATVVAVSGAFVGYIDYRSKLTQEVELRKKELRSKIYDQQFATYRELTMAATAIRTAQDPEAFEKAFGAFADIKHGPLRLVADAAVYDGAIHVYNIAAEMTGLPRGDARTRLRCQLDAAVLDLAELARRSISSSLSTDAHDQLLPDLAPVHFEYPSDSPCALLQQGQAVFHGPSRR